MSRYIVNRRSKIYHDSFYLTEKCNTDDAAYYIIKVDSLDPNIIGTATYNMCGHCKKQQDLERSGV